MVLVPVALQVGFFFMLKQQMQVTQEEARAQEISKRILVKVNLVLMKSADWLERMLAFRSMADDADMKLVKITDSFKLLRESIVDLNSFMERESGEPAETLRLRFLSQRFLSEADKLQSKLLSIEEPAIFILKTDTAIEKAGNDYKLELIKFSLDQENRTNTAWSQELESRASLDRLVNGAILLNILIAVGVMLLFMRGIERRLAMVGENAKRLSEGKPLHNLVKGTDEVALLDKTFHQMADTLSEAQTKERHMLKLLKVSEKRLGNLINNLPFALITISSEGKIEAINPSAEKLFSCEPDRVTGLRINRLLPLIFPQDHLRKAMPDMVARSARAPLETEAEAIGGERVPVEVTVSEFESEEGPTFVATVNDISERMRLEAAKRDFYSMVSHDIRSPLTSVRASLDLVMQGATGELSDKTASTLATARKSCERLLKIVNSLLEIDKLDSGVVELQMQKLDMPSLIEDAVTALKNVGLDRNIEILLDESKGTVLADADLLQRVIENLIGNAVKYSPDRGTVRVSAQINNQSVEVSVTDEGPGVPEHMRESIFERFKQVSTRDRKRGFGLGLAICKAIIVQHAGKIGVENGDSGGSRFWFSLPLSEESQSLLSEEPSSVS